MIFPLAHGGCIQAPAKPALLLVRLLNSTLGAVSAMGHTPLPQRLVQYVVALLLAKES